MTSKIKATSKTPNPSKPQACIKTTCKMPDYTHCWAYSALRKSETLEEIFAEDFSKDFSDKYFQICSGDFYIYF